mmetsp:Transcript_7134/g.19174  ORF Transcript_7134/g.19174 Transcript_7134/m.19174 type:complete len:289 (-) Transcript_7134:274-1140(-)
MLSSLRGCLVHSRLLHEWQATLSSHLGRTLATTTAQLSSEATSSQQQPSASSSAEAQLPTSSTSRSEPIYVACVLERLPVVASTPPKWETDFRAWEKDVELKQGYLKVYPDVSNLLRSQEEGEAPKQAPPSSQTQQFDPVPLRTRADASGIMKTMRRKLDSRLYLLVNQQLQALPSSQWQFPFAQHQGDEPIRQTCERAIQSAFGQRYPVYFIGNAPMAHLPLQHPDGSGAGSIFFMLAQVVDDPWDELAFVPGSQARDWVWVTRDEAAAQYLGDERLSKLACKMLSS